MKRSEIIGMNRMELKSRLQDNTEALRNLRFQKAMHQLENPLQLRYLRREIAQINTVLKELELKIRSSGEAKNSND
ncbi:MAG: 50S ribosomal protein L29 [Candidatus Marinimicrobia bacterium]|jgi:large subunit ribosomal protein L29|nr:50S ribosomal protein L29 [Candidatus Neomarinimicrobiota bacterium]MBT3617226.1 50S ribosomal protein L29 [Candidatus Neomarinimicrobiota bacterium]MBT3829737.1 50S ribosomal protein L29 [Candidatus Neomarinimicrobiota bacterium]MBT3997916.1 50S ribosomal protein L29 [Candidatus Neomarinimicrobiota bacterium]MBT4281294.1 50S ribosomal protein L29 [Candidatus Neomarinimicrobiota bacterium]